MYGLQAFKAAGATTILAHRAGSLAYLNSDTAQLRLAASRTGARSPGSIERTRLVAADRWLDDDAKLELGGETFHIQPRRARPTRRKT